MGALALHDDGDVGAARAFEHVGNGGGVEAFCGLAIDGHDDVAGANAGPVGGGALEGREDDDVDDAGFVGLGLDGHADAVVLAVLVFAHLGEGLWVVEVGVGVEDVEHPGDSAVVDGAVDFIGVEGLGVVLLDEGVDVGELVEGVAQGGFVGGGLGGDLLVDERADEGAGGQEKGDGEESATGTGGHLLGLPQGASGGVGRGRTCARMKLQCSV